MSFAELFRLRFFKGLTTLELEKLFPHEKQKICLVALCSLPDDMLRNVLRAEDASKVLALKSHFSRHTQRHSS